VSGQRKVLWRVVNAETGWLLFPGGFYRWQDADKFMRRLRERGGPESRLLRF
jgi:hypothetical protein